MQQHLRAVLVHVQLGAARGLQRRPVLAAVPPPPRAPGRAARRCRAARRSGTPRRTLQPAAGLPTTLSFTLCAALLPPPHHLTAPLRLVQAVQDSRNSQKPKLAFAHRICIVDALSRLLGRHMVRCALKGVGCSAPAGMSPVGGHCPNIHGRIYGHPSAWKHL